MLPREKYAEYFKVCVNLKELPIVQKLLIFIKKFFFINNSENAGSSIIELSFARSSIIEPANTTVLSLPVNRFPYRFVDGFINNI